MKGGDISRKSIDGLLLLQGHHLELSNFSLEVSNLCGGPSPSGVKLVFNEGQVSGEVPDHSIDICEVESRTVHSSAAVTGCTVANSNWRRSP